MLWVGQLRIRRLSNHPTELSLFRQAVSNSSFFLMPLILAGFDWVFACLSSVIKEHIHRGDLCSPCVADQCVFKMEICDTGRF